MSESSQKGLLDGFISKSAHEPGSVSEDDIRIIEDITTSVLRSRTLNAELVLAAVRAQAITALYNGTFVIPVGKCANQITCITGRLIQNHTQRGNIVPEVLTHPGFAKVSITCERVCGAPIREVPVPSADDVIDFGNTYSTVSLD